MFEDIHFRNPGSDIVHLIVARSHLAVSGMGRFVVARNNQSGSLFRSTISLCCIVSFVVFQVCTIISGHNLSFEIHIVFDRRRDSILQ